MNLKTESIGKTFRVKTKNGLTLSIVIENDSRNFDFYKSMGLDVFAPAKKAVVTETTISDSDANSLIEKSTIEKRFEVSLDEINSLSDSDNGIQIETVIETSLDQLGKKKGRIKVKDATKEGDK